MASGGSQTSSIGSISFTIGQVDYINIKTLTNSISFGIQQPYEISTSYINEYYKNIRIEAYPNPTTTFLNISIEGNNIENFSSSLVDESGTIILKQTVISQEYSLDTKNLISGAYFLIIHDRDKIVKIFKVVKT